VGCDFLVSDHGGQEGFDTIVTVQSSRGTGLNADARIYVGMREYVLISKSEVPGVYKEGPKAKRRQKKKTVYTRKAYRKHNHSDNLK
jgi:hypothetical protein